MRKQEVLREQQPIVWRTLHNALQGQTYAHAYLFYGPKGTGKKEMAVLFAQSILCKHTIDGFACETCNVCQRVALQEYADYCVIDGSESSIKKQDILRLQEMFTKTALEEDMHKIYILNHVENATNDAMNALLKFLEEPVEGVIAILISDQLESVMPTIVSRCQCIPFRALRRADSYKQGIAVCDAFDAYLLSSLHCSASQMQEISESEDYQHARYVFFEMMERMEKNIDQATLFLQLKGYPSKNKKIGKNSFAWLLDLLIRYAKDCTLDEITCEDKRYQKLWQQHIWSKEEAVDVIPHLLNKKDLLRRSVNLQLLADQLMAELKEVTK
ncbi:AAA family ATPase [Merdibacter massiliensis]|uniref:AAA family ATPase n=1 Tax=Merdibacter massiliensis TaxID=1871030 RepID=UPI00096A34D6|nr:AAA family ATPase [Merdibacter massiliensis]